MTGSVRGAMAAGLLLALAASPAMGSGPWWGGYGCGPSYYYYPYPMYVAPAWTYPVRPLAQPRPAGPSGTTVEPPMLSPVQRAPKVMESRHSGSASAGHTGEKKTTSDADRCRVGFWNVTGRDVTLIIDGQPRHLPRDRA